MLLSPKAGNAPKLAHSYLREYGRIRPYSCCRFWQKDSRSSFRAQLKRRVWAKLALLVRLLSRCAARAFAFFMRWVALALSAPRVSCTGFRVLQARLLRYPLRALCLWVFSCCKRGFGGVRFACFSRYVSSVAGVALAVCCVCDVSRLCSKPVRAQVQTPTASPQQQANKALHPTAYSFVPSARSSLRSLRFRRRVSLVVSPLRKMLLSPRAGNAPKLAHLVGGSTVEFDRTQVLGLAKGFALHLCGRGLNAKFCKSCLCVLFLSLKARLLSKVSLGGGLLSRYSRCVCRALLFCWCERGSCAVRFALLVRWLSVLRAQLWRFLACAMRFGSGRSRCASRCKRSAQVPNNGLTRRCTRPPTACARSSLRLPAAGELGRWAVALARWSRGEENTKQKQIAPIFA